MPSRFQKIDEAIIGDHAHLTEADSCYFLCEYTSNRDYKFGKVNQLISNLKKPPSRSLLQEYRYKHQAMGMCVQGLSDAINDDWLRTGTLVPIPPSKAKSHPDYDDRMLQICKAIKKPFPVDVRELVVQRESIRAAHESRDRPTVEELLHVLEINRGVVEPTPTAIAIVDDVLTAGTHYRAMHRLLKRNFPNVPIVGMFIARRIFPTPAEDEVFDALS